MWAGQIQQFRPFKKKSPDDYPDDRAHYENEANQIRRIAQERAQAEVDRIREEEENKRRVLAKKHAVSFSNNAPSFIVNTKNC